MPVGGAAAGRGRAGSDLLPTVPHPLVPHPLVPHRPALRRGPFKAPAYSYNAAIRRAADAKRSRSSVGASTSPSGPSASS